MELNEIEYFYKQLNIDKLYNELNESLYYRLVSTYIPNTLPYEGRIELTNYFIEKVYNRTGKKLDRKNRFILDLVKISKNYHTQRKKYLSIDNTQRCGICRLNFNKGLPNFFEDKIDILNPITYISNRNKLHEKCIDHILPISKIGSNEESNLQYICTICNSAKTDICTILDKMNLFSERIYLEYKSEFIRYEKEFIEKDKLSNKDKSTFYPLSLYYRVIRRYNECFICKSTDKLLTTMPLDSDTLYTFDNLVPICYDCLDKNDTISNFRILEVANL